MHDKALNIIRRAPPSTGSHAYRRTKVFNPKTARLMRTSIEVVLLGLFPNLSDERPWLVAQMQRFNRNRFQSLFFSLAEQRCLTGYGHQTHP